jgi:polyisoprenoid-binding protein YceI
MRKFATLFGAFALSLAAFVQPARADSYTLDPVHSALVFKVSHLGSSYSYGVIHSPEGKVNWDSADPTKSSIEVTAKLSNLSTFNAKRDEHLKSPDFFDAKQFPTMTFKSTSIKPAGEDMFEVTGDLTIRGTTKPVTVSLKKLGTASMQGTTKTGFDGKFTINRLDYGVAFMPQGIGTDVEVHVAIEVNKN